MEGGKAREVVGILFVGERMMLPGETSSPELHSREGCEGKKKEESSWEQAV